MLVAAPDAVWVDDGHGLYRSDVRFRDESAVQPWLAQRLAVAAGRELDDAQPWVDAQLPVGPGRVTVGVHAVLPPIAAAGTYLSLRVLRPATQDLSALIAAGAIAGEAAMLLGRIIEARLAFLVSGGTSAGKTTLLAALLGTVAPNERILCVEDAPELAPQHPHLVRLLARGANVEGIGNHPAPAGSPGVADAAGPDCRRGSPRGGGRRPPCRTQHRPRRRGGAVRANSPAEV